MKHNYLTWTIGSLVMAVLIYFYYNELSLMHVQQESSLAFGAIYKSSIINVEVRSGDRSYSLFNANPVKKDIYHAQPVFSDSADLAAWVARGINSQEIKPPQIDNILGVLVGLTFDVQIPPEMISNEPEALGLKPPQAVVSINYIGSSETLQIGNLHKHGDKRYALLSSRAGVFIIPEKSIAAVLAPVSAR